MNWLLVGFFVEHALPLIRLALDVPQKVKNKKEQVNGGAK
jgi:hypothetical protein